MVISLIVAAAENNAIGSGNELPWNLPEDLKFFKRTTLGKPVLMGRKTYESLGKPLPGRTNIILSGRTDLQLPEGVLVCTDIQQGIQLLQDTGADEGFIIGGGNVFAQSISLADRIYLTRVHTIIANADAFFPAIDHTHWKLVSEEPHAADERHAYSFTFQQYERAEL